MAARCTLTIRRTGKTERNRFDEVGAALDALEFDLRAAVTSERRGTIRAFAREVAPGAQVVVRGEIAAAGGLRAGIDVRGDGSCEAYTGRWRRRMIAVERGEDAFAALRRTFSTPAS